jgi:hypothetical protein
VARDPLKLPTAVRAAEAITTLVMVVSKFALIKQLNVFARLFKAYAASQQHKIAFC